MKLAEMLELEEGRVRHVYQDTEGYWTIGIGRMVDERKGGGLSDPEIDFLLANDMREKTMEVLTRLPWTIRLNEPRLQVLIGMAFQMGIGNAAKGTGLLGFVNTLAAIRDERYEHAAEMMMQSKWAKQTPKRAKRMSRQMATGSWE